MPRNFYFGTDASIVAGSANFAALLSAHGADYGIPPSQSATFSALNAALQSAFQASADPSTRTRVSVEEKNVALLNMRSNAIYLTKLLLATPSVTDGQLIGLGLQPRAKRMRIAVPASKPTVSVTSVFGRVANLRVHESGSEKRGLPAGVKSAYLYSYIGDEPPADTTLYRFERATTRAITSITFPNTVPSGATVWLSAAWVNGRGEAGMGSVPMSFTLQGGAITAAG